MKIIVCKTENEAATKTLAELRRIYAARIAKEPGARLRIFLPTGKTPRAAYELMRGEAEFWGKALLPFQIDEFCQPEGIFLNELKTQVVQPLHLENVGKFWDSSWTDDQVKEHINEVLKIGIDVSFLGLGPNGHVGFHEPNIPVSFKGGRLQIENETRDRVEGAKTNEVLTFGLGTFLKAQEVILLVTGESKREIYKKFLEIPPTELLPATLLKNHRPLTVITDIQ